MEPHGNPIGGGGGGGGRAEAERWLGIAEKLLAGRDLVGSKTFAIRARDSDPRLEFAYQILAVVDTLIAGEKRINNQYDWYAILQLTGPIYDLDLVAAQYRRLAILLNPCRNRLPFSDLAFKLVSDAWSVLSNPARKSIYDNEFAPFWKLDHPPLSRGSEHHESEQLHRHVPDPAPARTASPVPAPGNRFQERLEQPQSHQCKQQEQVQHPPPVSLGQEPPERQQQKQQQKQHYKRQEQQQRAATEKSTRHGTTNRENNATGGGEVHDDQDEDPTFWTACPYCYNMYEYPTVYKECSLRCQNCQRAFHAVKIPAPPIVPGKEAYFSCWGFYPLGVSSSNLTKDKGGILNWTPFSPMFPAPQSGNGGNVTVGSVNVQGQRRGQNNVNSRKNVVPRTYIDDEDAFLEISDSSDDSDDEWGSTRQKKKVKKARRKSSAGRSAKTAQAGKGKNVKGVTGDGVQGGPVMQQVVGVASTSNAESIRKAAANNAKKQAGKAPKEWGKLDLNVEFSNEVEESAPGMTAGNRADANGEEDGIEGIAFFEGLDEFLSSLPILNVVGDDKVKAA